MLDRGVHLVELLWPTLTPLTGLAGFAITLLFLTVFTFYVQEIVVSGRDGIAALAESWRLVVGTGVWRVLGNQLLFVACLLPVLLADVTLVMHFGAHSAAGAAFESSAKHRPDALDAFLHDSHVPAGVR